MLYWALLFLIVAIIAGALGFGVVAVSCPQRVRSFP
jgi:uncharacterized membrane protein YtjA (UPF0391 family)